MLRLLKKSDVSTVANHSVAFLLSCHSFGPLCRPASWAGCTVRLSEPHLPGGVRFNSPETGDAFVAGILVAALLRRTNLVLPSREWASIGDVLKVTVATNTGRGNERQNTQSKAWQQATSSETQSPPAVATKKRLTPYTLYIREHYMSLKAKCKDDRKAIFSKCHEMWENESDEIKIMYERKTAEELEGVAMPANTRVTSVKNGKGVPSIRAQYQGDEKWTNRQVAGSLTNIEVAGKNSNVSEKDSSGNGASSDRREGSKGQRQDGCPINVNEPLDLESAVRFACLVASYHDTVITEDENRLDLGELLERAMTYS